MDNFGPFAKGGWLEILVGCMFSGKTQRGMLRVKRAKLQGKRICCLKCATDNRYDNEDIVCHEGGRLRATPAATADEMRRIIPPDTEVLFIDEVQFFEGEDFVPFVMEQVSVFHRRVILAMLKQKFDGSPFGHAPELLARADEITTLFAICLAKHGNSPNDVCGMPATMSQRLGKNRSAILLGEKKDYAARCRRHWSPEPEVDEE
ncbi:MAG: thymidine kinase [Patescibacteria group bacterium]|jgi:thymidine kinase